MNVIVYGTLKKGGRLHSYLENEDYIKDVDLEGFNMYDMNLGFPFIEKATKENKIKGELYKINHTKIKMLDVVEGVPSLFKRTKLSGFDEKDETYVYTSSRENMKKHLGLNGVSIFKIKKVPNGFWKV
tara:strand:+ start:281 stop:664 length:384 start_codon:yes stop_codon:yes gene_type:complete